MTLRFPRVIRNLPTPVKVVGGAGLAVAAYQTAGATRAVTGIGAAVLLGSAAADAGLLGRSGAAMLGAGEPMERNPADHVGENRHEYFRGDTLGSAMTDGMRLPLPDYMRLRELEKRGLTVEIERDRASVPYPRMPYWTVNISARDRDGARRQFTPAEIVALKRAGVGLNSDIVRGKSRANASGVMLVDETEPARNPPEAHEPDEDVAGWVRSVLSDSLDPEMSDWPVWDKRDIDVGGRRLVLRVRRRRYPHVGTAVEWDVRVPGSPADVLPVAAGVASISASRPGVLVTGVSAVAPEAQHVGLYPMVLTALRDINLGPIESGESMSAGAIRAWQKIGAVDAERAGTLVMRKNPAPTDAQAAPHMT